MKELMLMAAMMLPFEKLLDDLKESITEFEKDPANKEAKSKLSFSAMMVALNVGTEGKDVMNTVKDFSDKSKLTEAFETSKY